MKIDKGIVVRVTLFVLAWVNSFLASKGFKTIPVLDDSQIAEIITFAVTGYGVIKHEFFGKKKVDVVVPVKVEQSTPKVEVKPEPVSPAPVAQPTATQDSQTK